jgi:transcriptional regulator with XRE-family HTH domain
VIHIGIHRGLVSAAFVSGQLYFDYMIKNKAESASNATAQMRLSRAFSTFRQEKKLTLASVSTATGISRNTLFLIEHKAGNARLSTIDALATVLDIDSSQLLHKSPTLGARLRNRVALPALVSQNIAIYRAALHMTQEQLGAAANLAKNYVSLIEVSAPDLRIQTVETLAQALGVDVALLLADSREKSCSSD